MMEVLSGFGSFRIRQILTAQLNSVKTPVLVFQVL